MREFRLQAVATEMIAVICRLKPGGQRALTELEAAL
jgi:hypothetical protein